MDGYMDGCGWKKSQTDKADVSVVQNATKRKTVHIPSGIYAIIRVAVLSKPRLPSAGILV